MSNQSHVRRPLIYTRYSSSRQDPLSCPQQERKARQGLQAKGIDDSNAIVINDAEAKGKRADRTGYQRVWKLIQHGGVSVLAVDQLSRLTRGHKTVAFLEDCCYHDTRVIAIGDHIDTNDANWQISSSVRQIVNAIERKDIAHRVRRTQEARLVDEDCVSIGDHPLGYRTEYSDPDWLEKLKARKKPRKVVVIDEEGAETIRMIFDMYVRRRMSLTAIARELNCLRRPKSQRSIVAAEARVRKNPHASGRPAPWRPDQIADYLDKEKYAGRWPWGRKTRIEDSDGNDRRIDAPVEQHVEADRQSLRIIDEETWQECCRLRMRSREQWGEIFHRESKKLKNGYSSHPRDAAPAHNLQGILRCGKCGGRLWKSWAGTRRVKFFYCSNSHPGGCTFRRHVSVTQVDRVFYKFVAELCSSAPGWIESVQRGFDAEIRDLKSNRPRQRDRLQATVAELDHKISNLVAALSRTTAGSDALTQELEQLEATKREASANLQQLSLHEDSLNTPDRSTVMKWLKQLPGLLSEPCAETRQYLRGLFPDITVHEIQPGTKYGSLRLKIKMSVYGLVAQGMGQAWREHLEASHPEFLDASEDQMREFEVDVHRPTKWRRFGPEIARLREEGFNWREISERLDMTIGAAASIFKDWQRHQSE